MSARGAVGVRGPAYGLPFVDEHEVVVAAGADAVWRTLTGTAGRRRGGPRETYARLVGARPVAASEPALVEGTVACRSPATGSHLPRLRSSGCVAFLLRLQRRWVARMLSRTWWPPRASGMWWSTLAASGS